MTRTSRVASLLAVSAVVLVVSACSSKSTPATSATSTTQVAPVTTVSVTAPGARPSHGCERPIPPPGATTTVPPAQVTIDGADRTWQISNSGTDPHEPAPLIVAFHGMGQNTSQFAEITGLFEAAAKQHTMVVIPQGVGTPAMWQPSATSDDARFVDVMLDKIEADYCIDTARVYLAGFSVGAFMAAAYGCANQDRVAALALVSVQFPADCKSPMPVIAFHGSADPIVPYAAGAKGAIGGGAGTEANMAKWAAMSGCAAKATQEEVAAKVMLLTWSDCDKGSAIELYRIDGGGHAWPGSDEPGNVPVDESVDATALGLKFLTEHHR